MAASSRGGAQRLWRRGCHAAQPLIIRKPDRAVWPLDEGRRNRSTIPSPYLVAWNLDWPRGRNKRGLVRVFTHNVPSLSRRIPAGKPPGYPRSAPTCSHTDPRKWKRPAVACTHNEPSRSSTIFPCFRVGVQRLSGKLLSFRPSRRAVPHPQWSAKCLRKTTETPSRFRCRAPPPRDFLHGLESNSVEAQHAPRCRQPEIPFGGLLDIENGAQAVPFRVTEVRGSMDYRRCLCSTRL